MTLAHARVRRDYVPGTHQLGSVPREHGGRRLRVPLVTKGCESHSSRAGDRDAAAAPHAADSSRKGPKCGLRRPAGGLRASQSRGTCH